MFKPGDHVWADSGEGQELAHVVSGPHLNADGETKYKIQLPGGRVLEMGHREPSDRDDAGSGLTFWTISA